MSVFITITGEVVSKNQRFGKHGEAISNIIVETKQKEEKISFNVSGRGIMADNVGACREGDYVCVMGKFEAAHGRDGFPGSWQYLNVYADSVQRIGRAKIEDLIDDVDDIYTEPVRDMPRICDYGDEPEMFRMPQPPVVSSYEQHPGDWRRR